MGWGVGEEDRGKKKVRLNGYSPVLALNKVA